MIEKISVCDGKYEIVYDNKSGALSALRYGESWRNLSGDKMVFALFCEIQDLRAKLAEALKPSHNTASDAIAFAEQVCFAFENYGFNEDILKALVLKYRS